MNESFGYRYNPNYVPEPHFIPGYGGHLPGLLTRYGITYGNATHQVFRKQPALATRLVPLRPEDDAESSKPLDCNCDTRRNADISGNSSKGRELFIPEHICPGYTGCLSFAKKGVPMKSCCEQLLRSLGHGQDPYEKTDEETEDPFPGPPAKIPDDFQEKRRNRNGFWMRFPDDYVMKENFKWM